MGTGYYRLLGSWLSKSNLFDWANHRAPLSFAISFVWGRRPMQKKNKGKCRRNSVSVKFRFSAVKDPRTLFRAKGRNYFGLQGTFRLGNSNKTHRGMRVKKENGGFCRIIRDFAELFKTGKVFHLRRKGNIDIRTTFPIWQTNRLTNELAGVYNNICKTLRIIRKVLSKPCIFPLKNPPNPPENKVPL